MKDPVVESVIQKLEERSERGKKKYGVMLDRPDLSQREWLIHLQEELMDAVNYLEVLIHEREEQGGASQSQWWR